MRCPIWYHLYNLENVKNTHGGMLILVKLQASSYSFTKINTPPCFSRFLNCTNGTKSGHASHIVRRRLFIYLLSDVSFKNMVVNLENSTNGQFQCICCKEVKST